MSDCTQIPAGKERAQLIAVLKSLVEHAQAFDGRRVTAATVLALACFDAMQERMTQQLPLGAVSPELVERLRSAAKFGTAKRYLAVPIDLPDVEALLASIDSAQSLATNTAAAEALTSREVSNG